MKVLEPVSGAGGMTPETLPTETWQWISRSARQTFELGFLLGQCVEQGGVIGLQGELGAGKTHFVQGIARGLGVPATVHITSPTYSLVNPYDARLPLYHLDVYRLGSADELEMLGFRDMLGNDAVTVVEWSNLFPEVLPEERLEIQIAHRSLRTRAFALNARGQRWCEVVRHLREAARTGGV